MQEIRYFYLLLNPNCKKINSKIIKNVIYTLHNKLKVLSLQHYQITAKQSNKILIYHTSLFESDFFN